MNDLIAKPRRTVPQNVHPCVRRLFELLSGHDEPNLIACERAGVPTDTVRSWRTRNMPRVDSLDAALNSIGYELVVMPKGSRENHA
jgi:hypothetical protein